MTWLTVATVVKDDLSGLERSLASLAVQDLAGVEWVVVDGSTAGEAPDSPVRALVEASGLLARYVHTPPRGIYPAMNTALETSQGTFVHFLNAGDAFASPTVLASAHSFLGDDVTWAFGPVEILEVSGRRVVTPAWDYAAEQAVLFSRGHFPPHQGTFVRADVLRTIGGFDTSYRIAADYAAFLRLSLLADPVELPFVVASFAEGGTSTLRWQESFREFHRARRSILRPSGVADAREQWETVRHFGLVYAAREIRPRLSWLTPWTR